MHRCIDSLKHRLNGMLILFAAVASALLLLQQYSIQYCTLLYVQYGHTYQQYCTVLLVLPYRGIEAALRGTAGSTSAASPPQLEETTNRRP